MPHLLIFPAGIFPGTPETNVYVSGEVSISPGGTKYFWETQIPADTTPAQFNTTMTNAAIAAVEAAGHTVLPSDRKTLMGGAV